MLSSAVDEVHHNNPYAGGIGGGTVESGNTAHTRYFNGSIDDFMIWPRVLTAEQVAMMYSNRTDVLVSQENHEVYIVGQSRFSIQHSRHAAADNVTHSHTVQRAHEDQEQFRFGHVERYA